MHWIELLLGCNPEFRKTGLRNVSAIFFFGCSSKFLLLTGQPSSRTNFQWNYWIKWNKHSLPHSGFIPTAHYFWRYQLSNLYICALFEFIYSERATCLCFVYFNAEIRFGIWVRLRTSIEMNPSLESSCFLHFPLLHFIPRTLVKYNHSR